MTPLTPEQRAREKIDASLVESGWTLQNRDEMNLSAARGVGVREFKLAPDYGYVDYMLFVDGKAVGVLEAKPEGYTLSGVEIQADRYSRGLPAGLEPPVTAPWEGRTRLEGRPSPCARRDRPELGADAHRGLRRVGSEQRTPEEQDLPLCSATTLGLSRPPLSGRHSGSRCRNRADR
jgi:hypothetical protein